MLAAERSEVDVHAIFGLVLDAGQKNFFLGRILEISDGFAPGFHFDFFAVAVAVFVLVFFLWLLGMAAAARLTNSEISSRTLISSVFSSFFFFVFFSFFSFSSYFYFRILTNEKGFDMEDYFRPMRCRVEVGPRGKVKAGLALVGEHQANAASLAMTKVKSFFHDFFFYLYSSSENRH